MTQLDRDAGAADNQVGGEDQGVEARLLNAASELFAERGYAAVGIREIARHAGVTIGALYHYASSKEMLLVSLLRRSYARLMPVILEAGSTDVSPVERIRSLTTTHIRTEVAQRDLWRVSRAELNLLGSDARQEVVSQRDEFEAVWDKAIDDGITSGDFTVGDARVTRMCIVEMCNGVGIWYREDGRLTLDQIIDEVAHNALLMLGVRSLG
jgi:AcrR family transcriptional regulator